MIDPQSRSLRQVTASQDQLLRILECLRFASVESIAITDGHIRRMKITISVDFSDPETFKKTIEELRTIPL